MPLIIGGVLVLAAGIFGTKYLFNGGTDPYRKYEELDVYSYLENSNSLRGNVYKVDCEILNSLAWSPTRGRLFSIGVNGTSTLPLLIPADFNHINIQKGQRFTVLLEVTDNGLLRARELTKS